MIVFLFKKVCNGSNNVLHYWEEEQQKFLKRNPKSANSSYTCFHYTKMVYDI